MAYASTHREQTQPELEHRAADPRLLTEEKSHDGDKAEDPRGDQDKMIIIDRGSSSDEAMTIGPRSRGDSLEQIRGGAQP